MKLLIAAACLAATLSLAGEALAGGRTIATLEQPVAARTKMIVAGSVWECQGGTCVAAYTPDNSFGQSECHDLVKHVGRITEFKDDIHSLETAKLERCNVGAPAAGTTTAAR